MDSLVCWILLVSVAGHTAGQPGPEVEGGRPVPLQSVHQQHPARLPEEVAVPPAVVDQPPVPCLSLLHHTAVTRSLECAVLAMIVPRAGIITDYSNTCCQPVPVCLDDRNVPLHVRPQEIVTPGHHYPVGGQREAAD